jgi:hypothetical protein
MGGERTDAIPFARWSVIEIEGARPPCYIEI